MSRKKKIIWSIAGLIFFYIIYCWISLFLSSLNIGKGYVISRGYYDAITNNLDLEKVFSKYGLTLDHVYHDFYGKTCISKFVVDGKSVPMIPQEVEQYILQHPDLVKDCRVIVEIMTPQGKNLPDKIYCKKLVFGGGFYINPGIVFLYGQRVRPSA